MYKKFVASFMTALMAAMMLVSPALGATALKDYPTFLGKVGDFYVVVGKDAAASDVAGAIDIAANLAQLSYKETSVTSGTTTSAGTTDRKIVIPAGSSGGQIGGSSSNQFPAMLRNFHYSGLKESKFTYKGTDHSYHEAVAIPTTGTTLSLTHSIGTPINGTLKMRADNNATEYRYYFDDTISTADFSATSANSTTYTDPLKVTVAGREFQIVSIPSTTSFKALVGTVKSLSDGESMTVGDLTLKVVQSFSSTTAKVEVTDPSGNVVKSGISTGSQESVSYGGSTYNYKILSSGATASGVLGYAQVLFGKGDIEKTFDGTTTATVSEWGADWVIAGSFTTQGQVTNGNFIRVTYNPASLTDTNRYFTSGNTFKGPGGYYELQYAGYYPGQFAKVTITPITGQTVYNSTVASGYSTVTSLNGLQFSSDVAGSLVIGSTGYSDMYILFNGSAQTTSWNTTFLWVAYKDSSTGRIVQMNTSYPAKFNFTDNAVSLLDVNGNMLGRVTEGVPIINITLSYGGPGASATYTFGTGLSNRTLLQSVAIWNSSNTQQVATAYQNRTTASTSSPAELILGTGSGTADTNDVQGTVEGSTTQDVSTQVNDLITDGGIQLYSVKSNVESNKVLVGVPPETVYGMVKFGKTTATTTATTTTVKEVVAITTAVAKLDSEITSADQTGKDLVLVGGPCKNTVTASALQKSTKHKYGCTDWPAKNFAVIEVIDDAFATGKQVVVVAGTRADDTRLASNVLQAYATKLSAISNSSVEVTGTALATATITAA